MEYIELTAISKLKTNELWIVQPKWYKSKYELTDNVFVYAKIYTKGFWHLTTLFETADNVLSITNLWNGNLEIKTADGNILGTIKRKALSGRTTFTLNDGRTFTYRAPSMWKAEYIWEDEFENELIRMAFGSFSGKTSVNFTKRAADIPYFSALVFIGLKLKLDSTAHG